MFKKMFYALVIVSMLVAAFGIQGVGVQTAKAADSGDWEDFRGLSTVTTFDTPYYQPDVDLSSANGDTVADLGGCSSAPGFFGDYQLHLINADHWQVDGVDAVSYVRVRIQGFGPFNDNANSWAVLISMNDPGKTELGCAINDSDGLIDFVTEVPAGSGYIVTFANLGLQIPDNVDFETWVTQGDQADGGMIFDLNGDGGDEDGRDFQASTLTEAFWSDNIDSWWDGATWNDSNQFWMDIPAGTYNLGVQDNVEGGGDEFAAYYPDYVVPVLGFDDEITPYDDAVIELDIAAFQPDGNPMDDATIYVNVNAASGFLFEDLWVGETDGIGLFTFWVNPGFLWDVALFEDNDTEVYFPVALAFNPTLGSLIFDLEDNGLTTWVRPCVDDDWDDGDLLLNPEGNLNTKWIEYMSSDPDFCETGGPWTGIDLYLTADVTYTVDDIWTEIWGATDDWDFYFEPTTNPWNFPAVDVSVADNFAYTTTLGDGEFWTEPTPATSASQYVLPLAAGEVALLRGNWYDDFGNQLIDADHYVWDAGLADWVPDEVAPEYWLNNVSLGWEDLAFDWETTSLGPVTAVGRYLYERGFWHGDLSDIEGHDGGDYDSDETLFSINPSDITMASHWSWSWVMAMYEYGFTTGLTPTTYGPEELVTRGQMAAFLSRVMTMAEILPTGLAPAFSDTAGNWAAASIQHLRDYGISNGCGDPAANTYCPDAVVTRAEMAKFIQTTFRTIHVYGPVDFWWDEDINVLVPGLTFVDVPQTHWANVWIEELFWDNLTAGCMRDGLTIYFCPDEAVSRGQMAKFIITAIQPDFDTQGFWPILSPSK